MNKEEEIAKLIAEEMANTPQITEQSLQDQAKSIFNSSGKTQSPAVKDDDPQAIIEEIHKAAILHQVRNDEETNQKFIEQAKKTVANELDTIDQDNISRRQKATYNANAEACKCYGIEDAVPLWQIRLMRAGHAVWFVIYWIFASVTICPVNVFVTGINAFIKRTWLSVLIAIIIYLSATVLVPILITFMKKGG